MRTHDFACDLEADMKKPYEEPAIVRTEPITGRAVVCARADDSCRVLGPINS